ncbi:MAG TPA: enoyl-CoA hydratase-related protein, partial [Candidatus Baltobacteraceae bacterium]|nr:enoyl-CoA hydratase-related protein [Candidatus Baltobacteraceae bacterium]
METKAFRDLALEVTDGVVRVTMDRAEKRNALSVEMMTQVTEALEQVGADRANRAVILAANGPAFSAGHDLREMLCRDVEAYRETFDVCVRLME